ncbi:BGTF surface domain-containing protein [Natronoarchaeum philippinense]|uniref:BGTF surface domain-containing protein n=1 Tax=Natronoarchaeum philippinense TaxID=558529 RepID=UPI0015CD88CF|nr:BGTF surface domain-containing protein [Natronoarchaeum philippinense]
MFLAAMMVLSVVAGSAALVGTAAANHDGNSNAVDKASLQDETVYQGETLNVSGFESGEAVQLYSGVEGASERIDVLRASENGHVTIDTTDASGFHYLQTGSGDSANVYGEFYVETPEVTFEFQSSSIETDEQATLQWTGTNLPDDLANGAEFRISSSSFSGSELADLTGGEETDDGNAAIVSGNPADTWSLDLSTVGNYTFDIESVETTASDSASIEVTEQTPDTIEFGQDQYEGQVGNEVSFSFTAQGIDNPVYIKVGDVEDVNYEQHLEVTNLDEVGDEEITVTLNTYNGDYEITSDNGAGLNVIDNANTQDVPGALGPTGYELSIATEYGDGDYSTQTEQDVGYLTLNERTSFSEASMSTWTAPSDSVNNAEDLQDATLTETSTIANGDEMLVQVNAESVYGFVEQGDQIGHAGEGVPGMQLKLSQDVSGPNRPDATNVWATFGEGDDQDFNHKGTLSATVLSADQQNGTFIIHLASDEGEALPSSADLSTTIEMGANNNFVDNWDDDLESISGEFSIEQRTLSWGDSADEVAASADATVSGTTNVAPGTTIDTRARAPGTFVERDTPTVMAGDDANTFTASFDLSGETTGTEFELRAEDNNDAENTATLDATLVESTDGGSDAETMVSFGSTSYDVTKNDTAEVMIDVTAGADGLNTSVPLMVNGNSVASQDVSLDAEGTTTLTFEVNTSSDSYPVGEHELSTSVDNASASAAFVIAESDDGSGSDDSGSDDSGSDDSGSDDSGSDDSGSDDSGSDDSGSDDSGSDDSSGDSSGDSGSSGQPGFGIAVAILSLLGAAMLALRKRE